MPDDTAPMLSDRSAADVRRLQSRLASVAEDRDRRLAAKDVVIEDQERVIIALEAENEALKAGPREWRVAIRRPGVDGEGVSYSGLNEWEARRVYASETTAYAKDEPCATVVLLSRIVRPWEDVSPAFDEQQPHGAQDPDWHPGLPIRYEPGSHRRAAESALAPRENGDTDG